MSAKEEGFKTCFGSLPICYTVPRASRPWLDFGHFIDQVRGWWSTGVPPVEKGSVGVPPVLLVSWPVNPVQPRQITQVVAQLGQDHLTIKKRQGAYLPHWERTGATYSVAFRLADS